MEQIYNKLVRDNIPEIIKNNGEIAIISILDDKTYKEELEKKYSKVYICNRKTTGVKKISEYNFGKVRFVHIVDVGI